MPLSDFLSFHTTELPTMNPLASARKFSGFFFNDTATTEISTLSLHDALPIWQLFPTRTWSPPANGATVARWSTSSWTRARSEEHTSELQSRFDLVCRLLL